MRTALAALGVLLIMALAGCGDDDGYSGGGATGSTTGPASSGEGASGGYSAGADGDKTSGSQPKGVTIETGESQFGTILFDEDRRAIYLFDKEDSPTAECYGACGAAWPPVLTKGDPGAAAGADSKLLGTTERDDGATQVTYDGHPLYYYVDDPPGQVLCHNVEEFGGLWLVVQPSGEAVS